MADDEMRFRVLGSPQWARGGVALHVGRRRERLLLGLLLLDLGRVVPVHRLVDLLWHEEPPPRSARASLQANVSRLRRRLADEGAGRHGFTLSTNGNGYLLDGDPHAVDLHRFRALLDRAEAAREPAERQRLLGLALAEWDGPVLAGTAPDGLAQRLGAGFEGLYLSAVTQRAETRLALGQFSLLLAETARIAVEHPSDEQLARLRMVALYRSDQRAAALRVYAETRLSLERELEVEPGPELRRTHELILRAADPAPPKAPPVPPARQGRAEPTPAGAQLLPPGFRRGAFVGRARELAGVSRLVTAAREGAGLVMIVGGAGSGKTALALQWCRQAGAELPDCRLFLDLRGHSGGRPLDTGEAFTALLRALDVPYAELPDDPGDLARLYQRTLGARRVVLILDNAGSADQVRPLLPFDQACLTLVTSRNRLGGLVVSHGGVVLPLGPLSAPDAAAVVGGVIGADRAGREPRALAELTEICGRNPLALRVAAANLALNPDCSVADHVAALRSSNPLERLAVAGDPGSAVRLSFEHSYGRLDDAARELFRTLGLLPGPWGEVAAVVALTGRTAAHVSEVLDRLLAEHLVERVAWGHVRLHDLIWQYARLLAESTDPPGQRAAARARLLRWYLVSADAAARRLYPQIVRLEPGAVPGPEAPGDVAPPRAHFADRNAAANWLDTHRQHLVELITSAAADVPADRAVWELADTLRGYFFLRRHVHSWLAVARAALGAAERAGDQPGAAAAHQSLGLAHYARGEAGESLRHFERALVLARSVSWGECEEAALSNLAGMCADTGRFAEAVRHYTRAIRLNRTMGRTKWLGQQLHGLGDVYHLMGQLTRADRLCRQALELFQAIAAPDSIARVNDTLAVISLDLGRLSAARGFAREAQAGYAEIGNLAGQAEALSSRAMVAAEAGHGDEALRWALAAHRFSRAAGRPRVRVHVLISLGRARYQRGQYAAAFEHFRQVRRTSEHIGYLRGRIAGLLGCGACAVHDGRPREALTHAGEALALAGEARLPLQQGKAQAVLALAHAALGREETARLAGRHAEVTYDWAGYRAPRSPFVLGVDRPLPTR
ncbi:BTAD domain-containing putative transcriptional regulator [Streptomyces sp. B6B3]|uniref:AfsR/SARP family transcriptional regulator n=1 Tax=Streptomyces sp. B6B3 TaxID=3153570 RepID=UPI00325D8C7D